MATQAAERMMVLLKELSVITELDRAFLHGPKTSEGKSAYAERQKRREEISHEMKMLAGSY